MYIAYNTLLDLYYILGSNDEELIILMVYFHEIFTI
jgi:hypothetical protein